MTDVTEYQNHVYVVPPNSTPSQSTPPLSLSTDAVRIAALEARVAALEARIAQLEARQPYQVPSLPTPCGPIWWWNPKRKSGSPTFQSRR